MSDYTIPTGTVFTYIAAFQRGDQIIEIEVMREKVDGPSGSKQVGQRETGVVYPGKTNKDYTAAYNAIGNKNVAITKALRARFANA